MKRFLKIVFLLAALATLAPVFTTGSVVLIGLTVLIAVPVIVNLVSPYVNTGVLGFSNMDARMVYENSERALVKAFGTEQILNVVKLTQSFLRLERLQVANATLYDFPILDGSDVISQTEQRLKLQDSFIVSSIGIFSAAPSSSTDNTFLLDTYANTQKYAGATALQALWNAGNLSISVNRDIIVPTWDVYRHYNANQTQQTDTLGAGSPMDQIRGSFDGFYPCEPNIVCIGSKNTEVKINMKGPGISSITTNARIVIIFRGVLAQNSTLVS